MSTKPAQLPQFLKATEVAKILRVNRTTVYEAVQRDEIPGVVRVGRVIRFRRDAVLSFFRVPRMCSDRAARQGNRLD